LQANGLYARGWRQGTIFATSLTATVVKADGADLVRADTEHTKWVVASQDCDLDGADAGSNEPFIEIRMVRDEDPPMEWGIRSRKLRLIESQYVLSTDPHLHISPAALVLAEEGRLPGIPAERRLAFKTWLGKRYDRPAVPDHWVPLARRISAEIAKKKHKESAEAVRDILLQFFPGPEVGDAPRYSLFAITRGGADNEAVRRWLADVAAAISVEIGVADEIVAGTAEEVSFSLVENSYSADVTQVTWGGEEAPEGAT